MSCVVVSSSNTEWEARLAKRIGLSINAIAITAIAMIARIMRMSDKGTEPEPR